MKSRLKKLSDWNGENYYTRPGGILLKNYEHKICNDNINNISYGPSSHIGWIFDKPIDNMEWSLTNTLQ